MVLIVSIVWCSVCSFFFIPLNFLAGYHESASTDQGEYLTEGDK